MYDCNKDFDDSRRTYIMSECCQKFWQCLARSAQIGTDWVSNSGGLECHTAPRCLICANQTEDNILEKNILKIFCEDNICANSKKETVHANQSKENIEAIRLCWKLLCMSVRANTLLAPKVRLDDLWPKITIHPNSIQPTYSIEDDLSWTKMNWDVLRCTNMQ